MFYEKDALIVKFFLCASSPESFFDVFHSYLIEKEICTMSVIVLYYDDYIPSFGVLILYTLNSHIDN